MVALHFSYVILAFKTCPELISSVTKPSSLLIWQWSLVLVRTHLHYLGFHDHDLHFSCCFGCGC